jgi:predicted phosphodiesterase
VTVFGVVADVHGNLEALCAALFALGERGVTRVLCPGDLVGYNADGEACVALAREAGFEAVAGNHDLIAVGRLGFERCAPRPEHALRRTRRALSAGARAFLAALPATRVVEGEIALIHGGAADPCEYLTSAARVAHSRAILAAIHPEARICFFGHTHAPALWEIEDGRARARELSGTVELGGAPAFFINPGSVDAARKDGERRAQFAVFDSSRRRLELHEVPYDHEWAEARAALHGYRMTAVDALLLGAARACRRLPRALGRRRRGAPAPRVR